MTKFNMIKNKAYILAEVAFKSPDDGGRSIMPIGSGYAPYIRSTLIDKDLAVRINNIPKGAKFGELIGVNIELCYYQDQDYGALIEGVFIQLIEGLKIIAEGVCKSSVITI